MQSKPIIILTTVPNKEIGKSLAQSLIEKKLAACVNILPTSVSFYRWKGSIQQDSEHQILIKTMNNNELEIYNLIKTTHPYELPEILTISFDNGEEAYLKWIKSNTH